MSPLAFTNRYALTDAGKVFYGNTAGAVFSLFNKPFTNTVVDVFSEAHFLTPALFQQTLRRLRTFALQLRSEAGMTMAEAVDLSARKGFAVRISSDILDTKIDAKKIINVTGGGNFYFGSSEQVELPIRKNEIRFPPLVVEQFKLALTSDEGDALPAGNGPDRDDTLIYVPAQDTIIEGDGAKRFECVFGFTTYFVGIGNFGDAAYYYLGSKAKLILDVIVNQLVKPKLMKLAFLPSYLTDMIASSISRPKRLIQRLALFRSREEFDLHSKFHRYIISQYQTFDKNSIPLPAKAGSLLELFL